MAAPAAALEYDAAPSAADALPSDYASGVAIPTTTPSRTAQAPAGRLSLAAGPYCPLPERPSSPLPEDTAAQLERLVVDLLAVGQVGQAQAVALLLQQQRGVADEPGLQRVGADEVVQLAGGAAGPTYDTAGLQPVQTEAQKPVFDMPARPPTPRLKAAAIPVTKAAAEPPVGTSFERVVATKTIPAPPPTSDAVGTSFRAMEEGELEGPVSASDDFDAEFWELAAVPPRAPGGAGGPQEVGGGPQAVRGRPQEAAVQGRPPVDAGGAAPPARRGEESLDALEAKVAVALEEEALEKERARKLQEQLQRTTAAVAELQVWCTCVVAVWLHYTHDDPCRHKSSAC